MTEQELIEKSDQLTARGVKHCPACCNELVDPQHCFQDEIIVGDQASGQGLLCACGELLYYLSDAKRDWQWIGD